MWLSLKFALLLAFTVGVVAAEEDISPVLLWSSEPLLNKLPDTDSWDSVHASTFQEKYLAPLLKDSNHGMVVFIQDKLHVDDFSKYADVYASSSQGGAFKNIKQLMEDNFSLEMPQVIKPHLALYNLKQAFIGNVYSISSLKDMESLQLDNEKQFLLFVNLDSVSNAVDEEKVIGENDELIGHVMNLMQKRSIKYTALFTGKTSRNKKGEETGLYAGRHLLAETNTTDTFTFMNVSDNIYVTLDNVSICLKQRQSGGDSKKSCDLSLSPTISKADADDSKITRNGSAATVVLNYPDAKSNSSVYKVSIKSELTRKGLHWFIDNMTLSVNGPDFNIENAKLMNSEVDFTIPLPYSFHCTDLQMQIDWRKDNMSTFKGTYIRLKKYQLQAFAIQNQQFFNAQDCVGFFTAPIWMGLISSLVLLIILVFGVMMTLNVTVMDRFDDPKKKTITVTVTE